MNRRRKTFWLYGFSKCKLYNYDKMEQYDSKIHFRSVR